MVQDKFRPGIIPRRWIVAPIGVIVLAMTPPAVAIQPPVLEPPTVADPAVPAPAPAPVATPAEQAIGRIRAALNELSVFGEQIQKYRAEIDSVDSRIKAFRQDLAQPEVIEVSATVQSLEELGTLQADLRARLQSAEAEGEALTRRPAIVKKRLAEIPAELSAAEMQLAELNTKLTTLGDPAVAPGTVRLSEEELLSINPADANEDELRRASLKVRIRAMQRKIEMLQTEREYYRATAGLAPVQQLVSDRRLRTIRAEIDRTAIEIDQQKRAAAEIQNNRLQDAVAMVPPHLRELAQSNVELAELKQRLTDKSVGVRASIDDISRAGTDLSTDLTTAQTRIDSVGLTDALGLLLRRKREQNQALRFKFRPQSNLRDETSDYQIKTFELQDEAKTLAETEIAPIASPELTAAVNWESLDENQTREILIGRRRTLIAETLTMLESLTIELIDLDTQQRQLMQQIDFYVEFVDGNLFWIRSAPAAGKLDIDNFDATVRWLIDWQAWVNLFSHVISTFFIMPLRAVLCIAVAVGMIGLRPRMRRGIIGAVPKKRTRMIPLKFTFESLFWTSIKAAVWPVCFGAAAIIVLSIASGDPLIHGVGTGLAVTALYLSSRQLLDEVCRDGGLGDVHFRWPENVRRLVRRHLFWYTASGASMLFLLALYHEHPNAIFRTIGTRWASVGLFTITALFSHLLLRPRSPIYAHIARGNPESFWVRSRKLIWLATVLSPLAFACLALGGYLETAFQLLRSLQLTFLMLVGVLIIAGILDRLFRMRHHPVVAPAATPSPDAAGMSSDPGTNPSVSIQSISMPPGAVQVNTSEPSAATPAVEISDIELEESPLATETLDRQSRQIASLLIGGLALFGLIMIWRNVFPAVAFLDGLEFYTVGDGDDAEIVSWLDVAVTGLISGIIYYAVRNFPGLVEFVVLRRSSLDAGAKYAVTTLLRYVLLTVGVVWVLDRLRVPYEQLGWLLAAASVGLGFGLQEIVANFVSGIILLLERPVRVGDVVTIDGQTGLVSKIQMRSTTVTNWDRKELVIPNKDLITEKLLNWSLSNVVNRLVLTVGVAYGSDADRVRGILMRAVKSHAQVLPDPAPMINLETFGDSSLNFTIRCFLPTLDNRIEITHQLNTKIAKLLAAEGISIPFPQRDVNFRNLDPRPAAAQNGTANSTLDPVTVDSR